MHRTTLAIVHSLIACSLASTTFAGPDQLYRNPANNHLYRLTSGEGLWSAARSEAVALGGDLVAIADADENSWLVATFGAQQVFWIGLYQPPGSPEPAGGWQWSNDEPVTFVNWHPIQPDNCAGGSPPCDSQEHAVLNWKTPGVWDDNSTAVARGIVEIVTCSPADLTEPYGTLDFTDVVAFLTAFGAMDAAADLAPPTGVFDFSDVVAFLGAFGAGCP